MHGDRRGAKTARVAWTATRNLLIEDPEHVPVLMRITARKSVRVAKPVYHFVISWHRDERPTPDLMRQVADATCHDLDLDDHQRLYIAHRDTQNPHVHIVVNRVHPETGIAWQTSHDYRRIEQSLARQARAMGMDVVPGRHNGMIRAVSSPRRTRDGGYQLARRENNASHLRARMSKEEVDVLRPVLGPVFDAARSWTELRTSLATHGLALVRKGQGLVIVGASTEMKLSDLGAGIRLNVLEQRLGAWTDAKRSAAPAPQQTVKVVRLRQRREREVQHEQRRCHGHAAGGAIDHVCHEQAAPRHL